MSERSSHEPGTPSWVDLASPDLDGSAAFYGELLGWEVTESGPPEQTGGYRMCQLRGRAVAGMGPIQDEQMPPAWMPYVTVADADAAAARAVEAGGSELMGAMDVMDAGRMAVLADPTGGAFSIWQPREHIGAELVNEPGALAWNELNSTDLEASRRFFAELFGWEYRTIDVGGMDYTEVTLDGATIAGMMAMPGGLPEGTPTHWSTYFAVADCDASVQAATQRGAEVMVEPRDIPAGRFAFLTDPQGATFAVIALAEQD